MLLKNVAAGLARSPLQRALSSEAAFLWLPAVDHSHHKRSRRRSLVKAYDEILAFESRRILVKIRPW